MKYIDADKLIAEIERRKKQDITFRERNILIDIEMAIDSLQQDEKAVELEMCSQAYWEERGWMMIPPDVTLKGIESLLEQVRKKLQQVADASKMEQPGAPICGEVLNDGEHLPGLTVDSAQLHDRLKGFPDGTDVYIFIVAKEENHSGAV